MRILVGAIFSVLVFTACSKGKEQKIIRNCTGTYLNISEKNYLICNPEAVADYENGDKVELDYEKVGECNPASDDPICEMYFPFDGNVTIK
ncbi:MAG: hypothetical protein MI810_17265 [Flavobacteriales bacterium]|nr:hypothetical protein [Flavobacteriales bacterium]